MHAARISRDFAPPLVVLAAGALFVLLYAPYCEFHAKRLLEHDRAAFYLTTDVCANADTARRLGPHTLCDRSRAIIAVSPRASAARDTLVHFVSPALSAVPRAVLALAATGALTLLALVRNAAYLRAPPMWKTR